MASTSQVSPPTLRSSVIVRPDALVRTQLEQRFVSWGQSQGAAPESAAALAKKLFQHYEQAHRHYHHLGHIAASLAELDLHAPGNALLEGAIWFHDVIYDPERADNEEASIRWFLEGTREWIDGPTAQRISRLIGATDFRTEPDQSPEVALMIDIDLAILAADRVAYDAYADAIRAEYAHVPDDLFRQGRTKVMRHFLSRRIYRTGGFLPREERARRNIERELERLA